MAINTLKLALVAALGMMALMMSLLAISLSVLLVQKQQQLKSMNARQQQQLRTTGTTTTNNNKSSLLSNVLEQDSSKKKKWSNKKTKKDHPLKTLNKLGPQHRHRLSTSASSASNPRLAANVHLEHALMYAEEPPPFIRLEDMFHNDPQWFSDYKHHYEAMGVTPYMLHQRQQQQRLSAGEGADDEGNLIHQSYSTTMSTSAVPSGSSKKSRSSQSNFLQEWFYSLYAIDNSIIKVLLGPFASTSGSSTGRSSRSTSWFTGTTKKGIDGSSEQQSKQKKTTRNTSTSTRSNNDVASKNDTLALYHLQKAADMGHPLAHYWLGNMYSSSSSTMSGTENDESSLGKAMIHWHLAAMEGIQEAQMTLGYRYASAYKSSPTDGAGHMMVKSTGNNVVTTTSSSGKTTITITNAGPGGAGTTGSSSSGSATSGTTTTTSNSGMDDTFGVIGTCETALAYYQEAANTAMDEMEFSALKGKIIPSMDRHRLSDVHMHGSSSTLALHNKPDELPEALEYLRIRATTNSFGGVGSTSSSGSNYFGGDSQSAVTLANMHHYGMRGVSQDLKLALEYYELAANSALYNDYGKDVVDSWWTNYEQDVATHEQSLSHNEKDASSASSLLSPPAEEYDAYGAAATTTTTTSTGDDKDDVDDEDDNVDTKQSSKQKQSTINMFVTDHPDAAGQAAKFYMLGMGHEGYWDISSDDHVEEQHKVWKYCMMGAPGGLKTCSDRESNKDICDAEALNAFGLVYLKGLPALGIEPNLTRAIQYFNLAKDYGSVDALYHLSMMRMGWMNSDHDTDMNSSEKENDEFVQFVHKASDGEYMIVKKDPMTGHVTIESGSGMSSTNSDESDAEESSSEPPQNDDTLSSSDMSSSSSTTTRRTKYDKEYEFRRAMNAKRLITQTEYTRALQDLVRAANKGHLQSMHRVGLMYASGIAHGGKPNCNVALQYLRQIAEQSPAIAQRLRTAYRAYTTLHNPQAALRNYMVAAEAGIELAQSNAAWLLERGYCVSSSSSSEKCQEMSLKLWMLASKQGNAEASIRVGDYYYYKRLRNRDGDSMSQNNKEMKQIMKTSTHQNIIKGQTIKRRKKPKSVSSWLETEWPFAIYYITHPRQLLLPPLKHVLIQKIRHLLYTLRRVKTIVFKMMRLTKTSQSQQTSTTTTSSTSGSTFEKSHGIQIVDDDENENNDDDNFMKAAQYYRKAIETHHSARGHYNLAYMYEWGLGLKQDFHLAKRHYDSATTHQKEAQLAISIALAGMHLHEYFVERIKIFQKLLQRHVGELKHYSSSKKDKNTDDMDDNDDDEHYEEDYYTLGEMVMVLIEYMIFGSFENLSQKERRRRDIYMNHLLSVEVLLVYVLTCVMIWLMLKLWEQQQSKEEEEGETSMNNNNDGVNNNNDTGR